MAIYRINDDQQQELLGRPEYGMGYQLAHDRTYVFLNAEIAIDVHPQVSPDHPHPDSLGLIAGEDVGLLTDVPQKVADYEAWLGARDDYGDRGLEVAAHGSYPSHTYADETFWRYSAFRNDRRIRPDGSVRPGTYATTQNDSELVTSGPWCRRDVRLAQPPISTLCHRAPASRGHANKVVATLRAVRPSRRWAWRYCLHMGCRRVRWRAVTRLTRDNDMRVHLDEKWSITLCDSRRTGWDTSVSTLCSIAGGRSGTCWSSTPRKWSGPTSVRYDLATLPKWFQATTERTRSPRGGLIVGRCTNRASSIALGQHVQSLGLSWCAANVGLLRRAFALQAAGAWCSIAKGSSSTPAQIEARHAEIPRLLRYARCPRILRHSPMPLSDRP